MSTKARYENNALRYYDGVTFETVHDFSPVYGMDDFSRQAIDTTNNWTLLDTGGATEAIIANAANGQVALTLASTSEAELAGLSWGDSKTLILNQGVNVEWRFQFGVLPSGAGSIVTIGLAGSHNATIGSISPAAWFRADGSGAITVEHTDGTNTTSKVATGVTVGTTDWHVCRVDCSQITNVKFYIDGAQVAATTTFDISTVPTAAVQPYATIRKASGATVGTVNIDYCRWWQNRS